MRGPEDLEEWTPDERAAFDALPRQSVPPAHLEERVVDALRAERLLEPRLRARRMQGWVAAAAAAGALALFSSGMVVGQWMGGRSTERVVTAVLERDPTTRALAVQSAGSEYVRAVAQLSELMDAGDPGALDPGREAGRTALHAAALELARLSPEDPTIQMVLAVLEQSLRSGTGTGEAVQQTIWF